MEKGTFYIIPSVISEAQNNALAPQTIEIIHQLKAFVVERARTARRFIKSTNPPYAIQELHIEELETKDGDKLDFEKTLKTLESGTDVGLLSEAGCPGIADPGSQIITYLQRHHIRIIPLVGPSSIFLALMASGLNGQNFSFHGYLPIDKNDLTKKLHQLDKQIQQNKSTHIFIETPYRNDRMLTFLLQALNQNTMLCIASDVTGPSESIITKPIKAWKKQKPTIGKIPTVFLIG